MQINLKYIKLINSTWLSRDLLIKLKFGGNAQAAEAGTWEEQGDTTQMVSQNGITKTNECTMGARDAKNAKEGFYRYYSQKRKTKESVATMTRCEKW